MEGNNNYVKRTFVLDLINEVNSSGGFKSYSDYSTMFDLVDDMPAADVKPVNQWISVDDKLPEWDKTVLVWYASDTLFGVSEWYGLSWYHGSWRLYDLNGENIRILYWQYLPEKPKGGR